MHLVDLYSRSCRRSIPRGSVRRLVDVAAFVAVGGCFVAAASFENL